MARVSAPEAGAVSGDVVAVPGAEGAAEPDGAGAVALATGYGAAAGAEATGAGGADGIAGW